MKHLTLAGALACLVAASPAWATNGMRMTGFGPVQNAMGGVGVGATLDAASVVSNPAGMTDLGGRIDFGGTLFKANPEYDVTGLGGTGIPPGMFVLSSGKTIGI